MRHPAPNTPLNHALSATLHATLCTALLMGLQQPVWAQTAAPHDHTAQTRHSTDASGLPWTDGEVRRIDTANGKISLKHGEIKNLDMPPMTMVFQVRDPASLARLAVGDKVRFTADRTSGGFTVLDIEPQP